ncbi:oxidoreductase, partial [Cutibacterium acnes]
MANDGSVRHSSLELLGGGSDSLRTQHSLAIGGGVVDAAGIDMGDGRGSGAGGGGGGGQ